MASLVNPDMGQLFWRGKPPIPARDARHPEAYITVEVCCGAPASEFTVDLRELFEKFKALSNEVAELRKAIADKDKS